MNNGKVLNGKVNFLIFCLIIWNGSTVSCQKAIDSSMKKVYGDHWNESVEF